MPYSLEKEGDPGSEVPRDMQEEVRINTRGLVPSLSLENIKVWLWLSNTPPTHPGIYQIGSSEGIESMPS